MPSIRVSSETPQAAGIDHPPTDPEPLTRGRRWIAVGTLILFALIFMPAWLRVVEVGV